MMVKHIQAYFENENDAEAAATELKALGAIEVSAERVPDRDGRPDAGVEFSEDFPAIAAAQGPLSGAPFLGQPNSFLIGGLALGTLGAEREGGNGRSVVAATVDDRLYDKAVQSVEQHDGRLG